jgi:predicted Zn-dependent protease
MKAKRLIMLGVAVAVLMPMVALAYNYAGYRWGGSWPNPVVDYNNVQLVAWRNTINQARGNWNTAGARFTFGLGSSNNKINVVYKPNSNALATTSITRQYGLWGNVVKCTVDVNIAHDFNPPYSGAYDLASVMRHEFGHWLVLNHTNPPSLMQSYIGQGEVRQIGTDDRNGIRSIYGTN